MVTISADWFGWFGYLRFFGAHWGLLFLFHHSFLFWVAFELHVCIFLSLFLLSLVFYGCMSWMLSGGKELVYFSFFTSLFFLFLLFTKDVLTTRFL